MSTEEKVWRESLGEEFVSGTMKVWPPDTGRFPITTAVMRGCGALADALAEATEIVARWRNGPWFEVTATYSDGGRRGFAIWYETGAVYRVVDGAVEDDPYLMP